MCFYYITRFNYSCSIIFQPQVACTFPYENTREPGHQLHILYIFNANRERERREYCIYNICKRGATTDLDMPPRRAVYFRRSAAAAVYIFQTPLTIYWPIYITYHIRRIVSCGNSIENSAGRQHLHVIFCYTASINCALLSIYCIRI